MPETPQQEVFNGLIPDMKALQANRRRARIKKQAELILQGWLVAAGPQRSDAFSAEHIEAAVSSATSFCDSCDNMKIEDLPEPRPEE